MLVTLDPLLGGGGGGIDEDETPRYDGGGGGGGAPLGWRSDTPDTQLTAGTSSTRSSMRPKIAFGRRVPDVVPKRAGSTASTNLSYSRPSTAARCVGIYCVYAYVHVCHICTYTCVCVCLCVYIHILCMCVCACKNSDDWQIYYGSVPKLNMARVAGY